MQDQTHATPRIIATFVPQAWINDHAVDVDPEGETTWDVTDTLVSELSREEMARLKDNRDETDTLRDEDPAPEWVKAWAGPFYVRVQDSIADYLAATEGTQPPSSPYVVWNLHFHYVTPGQADALLTRGIVYKPEPEEHPEMHYPEDAYSMEDVVAELAVIGEGV